MRLLLIDLTPHEANVVIAIHLIVLIVFIVAIVAIGRSGP